MPKSISLLVLMFALFSCPVLVSGASSSVVIQDSPGITVTPRPVCLGDSFIIHIPIENTGDAAFNGLVYTYLSPPGQGPQIWKDSISLSPGETNDHQVLVSRMQSRSEYVGEWEVVAEIKRSGASLSSSNIDSSTFSFSINDCTNCNGTISGYVRDSQTGEGISKATLSCEGSLCGDAISREDGYYEFVSCLCPSTTYNVECSKEDYNSASMSVTTDRAGNAVEGILLEAEGMSGGLERSWAARDLSETFDDFSDDSDLWIYAGDAYRDSDNEYVVLTENKNDQAGVVWFKAGVEAPFVAEFKYKAGGGSGADGLVFMFNKQFETYSAHRGGSLGFWGSGYGVEFDNYLDAHNSDPSANHIALVKDGTDNHLIAVNDRRTEDNKWHDVKVSVETSSATIFVDDEEVLNWSEEINCTYDRIGFSAATGGANNWHMIDNVKIRSPLKLNESDYRFVVEPRTTLQGTETELRVTANLPALEERGEETVKMGDPIQWYITTPSGQEIEGEKDTFHESRAGGPSDVATYDFPEAGEYVARVELPESGLERAWTVYAHPQPEIDDGSNETGSSESDSSWIYEMDRYQTYSKVKGEIVQVELINVTIIDEGEIEAMLRVRNTRPARYNLETYDGHPLIKDFYNRTLTLDEEECITIPVRAVKRDDSYVAGLDVNVDFATYFLEHLMGAVVCTPSTETLVEIKESIKEEDYPDKTMREISLEGWALSTTEFFQDHPETLTKAAAECGIDLAVGEILDDLPLISQLMTIADGLRMTLDGLTCPSEETISIEFRRNQVPIGKELAEAKAEEILGSVDKEHTTGVQFYEHPTAGSNGYWVVFQEGGHNRGGKNVAVVVESTTGNIEEDETILLPVFYTIEVKQQYLDASQIGATHRANGEELIRLANELKEGKITTSRMKSAFSLIETTTIKIIFGPVDILTAGATSLIVSAYFDTAFSLMGEGDLSVYESYFYGTGYIERSYGDDIGSLSGRDMSFDTAYSINSIYPTTIVNLNIAEAATLDNEGLAESINGLRDVQKRIANADSLIWGYAAKDMMTSLEKIET